MNNIFFPLQECNLEEVQDEDDPPKSSKDSKKANGPDKSPSLVFKITSKIAYKTVLKGDFLVHTITSKVACKTVLKGDHNMQDPKLLGRY